MNNGSAVTDRLCGTKTDHSLLDLVTWKSSGTLTRAASVSGGRESLLGVNSGKSGRRARGDMAMSDPFLKLCCTGE